MKTRTSMTVLAVVTGILAIGAGGAQAAEFTADEYPATVSAEQVGEGVPPLTNPPLPPGTTGGGGTVEEEEIENEEYEGPGTVFGFDSTLMASCKTLGFEAELTGSSSELQAAPLMNECRAFGFIETTVETNECEYRFEVGEESEKSPFAGTVDLVCPEGKQIVVKALTCEVQIPSQSGLGPMEYENLEAEEPEIPSPSIGLVFKVKELTYVKSKDGFLCPLSGTGEASNGKILGGVFASGANEAEEAVGIAVE
jgi:hypothetical protein